MATENGNNFEAALFKTADKLRKNIDAAEYKNVVLGLIFLKYISDSFQELFERLEVDEYSDPEDRDEYIAENCFFVPEVARLKSLQAKAKLPEIGVAIDDAMTAIEKENAELKHVLPKVYAKPNLAIRNINSQFVAWNTEGTFLMDMNPDLKADYTLANPPFNHKVYHFGASLKDLGKKMFAFSKFDKGALEVLGRLKA